MLKRYFHTLRSLRAQQFYYRLYYALKKPRVPAPLSLTPRAWPKAWSAPRSMPCELSEAGVFCALGEAGSIDDPSIWHSTTHSTLWIYHLHYFDAINAHSANESSVPMAHYFDQWLRHNPPLKGHGWDPYPLSLRIVNWIICFARNTIPPHARWLDSLAQQAQVLMQRLEYHLLANHLFANGKALVFMGAYFSGDQADRWLKKGLQILDQEMKEQFLPDGGHFELSPMYHARMMNDVCDLVHLAEVTQHPWLTQRASSWSAIIQKGLAWMSCMVHPDGEIAFFNDAALGMAPTFLDLCDYAHDLHVPLSLPKTEALTTLKESGYTVVNLPHRSRAILDVAPIGPRYQPGHGHADLLSFEWSVHGQRWIVNSGISCYGVSAQRLFQRGTSAHSTVCVDGKNSSDVWSGFRVGQRATPKDFMQTQTDEHIKISCAHQGYGALTHRRTWDFSAQDLLIVDELVGPYTQAVARFYFHPDVEMIQTHEHQWEGRLSGGEAVSIKVLGAQRSQLEASNWYPRFGQSIPNQCLVIQFCGGVLQTLMRY